MYSPKISEEHIPALYRLAKVKKVRMTKLVNQIIKNFLVKNSDKAYAYTDEGIAELASDLAKTKLVTSKLNNLAKLQAWS